MSSTRNIEEDQATQDQLEQDATRPDVAEVASAPDAQAAQADADASDSAAQSAAAIAQGDSPAGAPATIQADAQSGGRAKRHFGAIRMRALNVIMIALAALVSIIFLQAVHQTEEAYTSLEQATNSYIECEEAANNMKEASNYLTIQVRTFVSTQNPVYYRNYFVEASSDERRESALRVLQTYYGGNEPAEYIKSAYEHSQHLEELELYAIKLVVEATGMTPEVGVKEMNGVELKESDKALSPADKIARAVDICFGDVYMHYVGLISSDIENCIGQLISDVENVQATGSATIHQLLLRKQVLTVLLLVVMVLLIIMNVVLVLWPLRTFAARIKENEPLPATGAKELRFLTDAYNEMYEENLKNHDALRRKAEHDHLTGLYNRSVFERLLQAYRQEPYALLLIDADYFKQINDSLGHDGGDAMLRKIAGLLSSTFRSSDYPCRIGGDEFAVIMTEVDASLEHVVAAKIKNVTDGLLDTSDGLPEMTLSIGIAFNDGTLGAELMYKNADQALYSVKESGRNNHAFYRA